VAGRGFLLEGEVFFVCRGFIGVLKMCVKGVYMGEGGREGERVHIYDAPVTSALYERGDWKTNPTWVVRKEAHRELWDQQPGRVHQSHLTRNRICTSYPH